ncbi:MAG: DUF302 domain-containing protein [Ignavibacteria bacterium]|jgi:uncharacterized protein (DUF302 family)
MNYYISKLVDYPYEEALEKITAELKEVGFGILTEIDVKETLKKKIDVDFRKYKILGACNPKFAHQALQAEDKVGLLMPCSVIVQEKEEGKSEIAIMDPLAAMTATGNENLREFAENVTKLLNTALERV